MEILSAEIPLDDNFNLQIKIKHMRIGIYEKLYTIYIYVNICNFSFKHKHLLSFNTHVYLNLFKNTLHKRAFMKFHCYFHNV